MGQEQNLLTKDEQIEMLRTALGNFVSGIPVVGLRDEQVIRSQLEIQGLVLRLAREALEKTGGARPPVPDDHIEVVILVGVDERGNWHAQGGVGEAWTEAAVRDEIMSRVLLARDDPYLAEVFAVRWSAVRARLPVARRQPVQREVSGTVEPAE